MLRYLMYFMDKLKIIVMVGAVISGAIILSAFERIYRVWLKD